jgi:TldD protein
VTLVPTALAERVIARALARGGDFGELYAEDRSGFSLSLDDGRIERPQDGRERGACVRVVQGDSTYYGYVDGLAEEDLVRVADSVAQALRGDAQVPVALTAATPAEGHLVAEAPADVEPGRKAELLRAADEAARSAGGEVVQARLGYV